MATRKREICFEGAVYRAHNPEWSWNPLSGAGARLHGGRFNRRGLAALYTSLDVLVAIREASPLGAPFHPVTLCQYRVDCEGIFDTRDREAMKRERVTRGELECPSWNQEMLEGKVPASQQLADRLLAKGYAGMLVRSFVHGAGPEDINLVLWKWTKRRPHKITLFDPDHRLPKDASSWRKSTLLRFPPPPLLETSDGLWSAHSPIASDQIVTIVGWPRRGFVERS